MRRAHSTLYLAGLLIGLMQIPNTAAAATSDPRSVELMQAVGARADFGQQEAQLRFTLTPKSGAAQVRESTAYRSVSVNTRKLAIAFQSPPAIRGSSFLAWDARDTAAADDQWLYLPALRRTRRIPGRERGSYFLGTDLTYDDIRTFGRIEVADYRLGSPQPVPGEPELVEVEGEPADAAVAQDLGYSRIRWRVHTGRAVVLRSEHWDMQGAPLKTIVYGGLEQIAGAWIATTVTVENLKTGHRTELLFSDITDNASFDPVRLTPAGLERGG